MYSAEEVPHSMVQSWRPRKSYMGQLELVAPLWALELWSQQLQERSVLLYVDNDSAATNLVKGYSPQPDSSNLVGAFWLTAAKLKLHIYILITWSPKAILLTDPRAIHLQKSSGWAGLGHRPRLAPWVGPPRSPLSSWRTGTPGGSQREVTPDNRPTCGGR